MWSQDQGFEWMIPHPREVNASKQNKCIHVTTGSNQNHINMEVKDTKSRSIRLLLYVGHCGVVAIWTKSGCLQCLLGEDVSCLGNFKVGVFCLLPELLKCSRSNLELGSGWLHCLRNLATWVPCLPSLPVYHVVWQLGNLGALPTYIACVHCLLGNLGALLAYTAYWAPPGEEVEGREGGSGFSHASHFSRSRQLESGQPHDYHEHQEKDGWWRRQWCWWWEVWSFFLMGWHILILLSHSFKFNETFFLFLRPSCIF